MRIPNWGVTFILCIIISTTSFSQENNTKTTEETEKEEKLPKDVQQAYDAYEAKEYTMAIELLKRAFSEVRGREKKSEILFMTGQSYRYINDYQNAERNYEKAVKLGYEDPVAQLYYGDMLKAQGEYEEAIEAYKEYKKMKSDDPRADIAIESTRQAIVWQNEPSLYQVSNMGDINSRSMDFATTYGGKRRENDVLIFASSREESTGSKEDGWTGESFMDLYVTSAERKSVRRRGRGGEEEVLDASELGWSVPVPLDEEQILNTDFHEGPATFDSRKKTLYFTKCIKEKERQLGCAIWSTEEVGRSWKEPEPVIIGADSSSNVGHPSLSPDDKFLYFVSNDYETIGNHDIFLTTYDRHENKWTSPRNLGPKVNTEREEYYPFAHDDGYLYFASDGHPGMGGLDIFRIQVGEDGLPLPDAKAENLKYPVNTNWDDFAVIFEPGGDTKKGFLSSNRKGGRGSDDIYAVFKTPKVFRLEGVVTNSKTGAPIPEPIVKLDGSDGTSLEITGDEDGYYIFEEEKISEGVQYTLTFEKRKFLSNTGSVTTIGVPMSAFEYLPSEVHFLHVLRLNKALDPIEEPIVLPNVFFDLAKWDLRPEARNALDSVVTILNNNPTIVIELRSHTDYRDTDQKNEILSQKRADTCVSYLASKGIAKDRMVARGMGETEPFVIPENYKGYGSDAFEAGARLTEAFIKKLSPEKQEIANQINRRTDFKVIRDDYVPSGGVDQPEAVNPKDIIQQKREEAKAPGKIYIVQGRESFGVVARKNNINIVELKRLNGGLRGVRPFEGLQLKVEPDGNYEQWDAAHYQVQRRGQDFKDIARTLSMDDDKLEELNPEVDDKDLQPGFWVKIK